jgi:hypothetical protein
MFHKDSRSFTEFSSEKLLKLMYVLKLFLAGFILPFICTEIKLWTSLIPQPMKKRKSISQPAPFMNKTLRSALYKKRMTHNKFLKDKSNKNCL